MKLTGKIIRGVELLQLPLKFITVVVSVSVRFTENLGTWMVEVSEKRF